MSSLEGEDTLIQDMHALVYRYGKGKCQEALNAVKIHSSNMVAKDNSESYTFEISSDAVEYEFTQLMRWVLLGDCEVKKISLDFVNYPQHSNVVSLLLSTLKQYYDALQSRNEQEPNDAVALANHRLKSRFHALYIHAEDLSMAEQLLRRKEILALFKVIVIRGSDGSIIRNNIMRRIKEHVVEEGVISSLNILDCILRDDETLLLSTMLQSNQLEFFVLKAILHDRSVPHHFGQALSYSLDVHTDRFPQASILKQLDLFDTMDSIDANVHREILQELFDSVGRLPNLEYFGIQTSQVSVPDILAASIGHWKLRFFRLCCEMPSDTVDFQPLFDAIANSGHLKTFDFGCEMETLLSARTTGQLFDLALSPNSGLREIVLEGAPLDLRELYMVVPEDVDPNFAARRQLHTFRFMEWESSSVQEGGETGPMFDKEDNEEVVLENLWALNRLLSAQLPHLHCIGLTNDDWADIDDHVISAHFPDSVGLWEQVWVQLEMNRIGMSLFQPGILSTVPSGLWSTVLKKAITCEKERKYLPWTGIYRMVQKLVEGGHTGWSQVRNYHRPSESLTVRKRPKLGDM